MHIAIELLNCGDVSSQRYHLLFDCSSEHASVAMSWCFSSMTDFFVVLDIQGLNMAVIATWFADLDRLQVAFLIQTVVVCWKYPFFHVKWRASRSLKVR
jgi:hypothetical protein